jgi:hypothetical protein
VQGRRWRCSFPHGHFIHRHGPRRLRDVEFLASAIGEGLGGTRTLGDALADFEWKRNEASARDYQDNVTSARFSPFPPEFLAVRAAVRDKPDEATRLVKAQMRMINPSDFFNPDNMRRLLAAIS